MTDTTIRVSTRTYELVVRARGKSEQRDGIKRTLNEEIAELANAWINAP
jgi:hypothetical protein